MNHLFAFEDFEDADSDHIEPLVEGKAGGNINNFLFILPRYLKKQQLNPSHKLVYKKFCLCVGLHVGVNYSNQLVVVEKGQVLYHFCLHFAHDIYTIILLLLDVVGVVHDHLNQTGQRDIV